MGEFLLISFVFLVAGVIAVPVASKLGLGSVLGYLLAGIAIGPILTALGVDVISLQHFAEFGVVMMLFLVGLELEPRLLWQMRSRLLGLGGLQVVGTALAVMACAVALGQPWTIALAIGLVLSLSSTAIVLQTLGEKGLMSSEGGRASFSVLLFQDIAVIPMLALLPLLAMPELAGLFDAGATSQMGAADAGHGSSDDHGTSLNLVAGLPGWAQALVTLGAIAVVIVGGAFLTRPLFRFISFAGLREMFTAAALMIVIGISLLMTLVGLSPALGTFLAGVVLANSEYRHELESDIDPFKGLLLGLFFITVGAGVDFGLLGANFLTVIAMTLALIAAKAAILLALAIAFGIRGSDRWLFSLGLAQAGEFGFVLLAFTTANNVIPQAIADQLLLVVALSMLLTPALFILYERVIEPRFDKSEQREPDAIEEAGKVIIAGHGRFGGIVNRMLLTHGIRAVVLDHNSAQLNMLRTFGVKVYYGDASRPDLLHSAGIADARLLVVAIDNRAQINEIVHHVHKNHPHVHIVARAIDRGHVYELVEAGADDIIRETFDSSLRAGRSAFEALGVHPHEAERYVRQFARKDQDAMVAVAELYDPDIPLAENTAFVERTREVMRELEADLRNFRTAVGDRGDTAWHPPTLDDVKTVTEENEKEEKDSA